MLALNGRAIAQAISRWPVIAEDRVRSQISPCEFYGGQSGIGTGFCPSSSGFRVNIIPQMLRTCLVHVAVTRTNGKA
jgi:hypothetical protein